MIYLDHHSTTPVDPRVLDAMLPFLRDQFGNAASRSHAFGHRAKEAVDTARAQVAALVGGRASEVVFTSGATESDNLAIKGVAHARKDEGRLRVVTLQTEHKAVLDSVTRLAREGFEKVVLPVGADGRVDLEVLRDAVNEQTALVSVMLTNNEVGAVQDLAAIGEIARSKGAWLHCDAAQGLGYIPLDVQSMPVDLVTLTGHKIYAPKGVGALWVRKNDPRVRVVAELDGGGHERGMRSGTLAVPGIVALGAACEIQKREGPGEGERLRALASTLWERLSVLDEIRLNGPALGPHRHPGNLNVAFGFVEGEGLLLALAKTMAVSSGAACTSASIEPSYVLRALGLDPEWAAGSIRFGLGRGTTEAQIEEVAAAVVATVRALRAQSPLWAAHQRGERVDW
ncbi:MAG: aminotransferase class V-fold PLP-dependent enzyme [Myxococcota bacterium]